MDHQVQQLFDFRLEAQRFFGRGGHGIPSCYQELRNKLVNGAERPNFKRCFLL
jgi:hypothetical protein